MFKAPDVEVVLPPRFWVVVGASDEFVWTRSVLRGLEFDKVRDRGPTVHGIVCAIPEAKSCSCRSPILFHFFGYPRQGAPRKCLLGRPWDCWLC